MKVAQACGLALCTLTAGVFGFVGTGSWECGIYLALLFILASGILGLWR